MKSLIVVHSYHHNNTLKVAKVIADIFEADLKTAVNAKSDELKGYDLVGFGAGIDSGMHYKQLLDFVNTTAVNNHRKKCFIFSTSAVQGEDKVNNDHSKLREILRTKRYKVEGEFSCKGFNTNSFLKYIGGMNKSHPDDADMNDARQFAAKLL